MDSSKNKITVLFHRIKSMAKNRLAPFLSSKENKFNTADANNQNYKQEKLDKKLVYSLSKSKIPSFRQIKYIKRFLNPKELWWLRGCLITIIICFLFIGAQFYRTHLKIVPIAGGEYTEGLVGTPKYINPLYSSTSDVDGDIAQLIFSSILKRGKNSELANDLAKEYIISEDNKAYTFTIRDNLRWQNGEKLTVDDIIFTFNAIKDSQYNSPLRSSFIGVNIEKVDDYSFKFILEEPYAAFLELLTFGILPQNLWTQISPESASLAELNLKPVGSGPYKFKSLIKDKAGNVKEYKLVINQEYYDRKPYIENLNFKFFVNFEEAANALNGNIVDGISYVPRHIKDNLISQDSLSFYKLNFPQITAIFFNQKNTNLADKKIRQALALAIDKNDILQNIFNGEIRLIDGPILPDNFAYNNDIKKYKYNLEEAEKLLDEAGWKKIVVSQEELEKAEIEKESEDEKIKNSAEEKLAMGQGEWRTKDNKYLTINLMTIDTDEYVEVAETIKRFWQEAGVKTILNIVPAGQIQSEVIRPRNFDALLYAQVVGNDPDSYVLWHSSQTSESGLNVANFTNKKVDQLLEEARLTSDKEERIKKYKEFQEILAEEEPAIFLFSPVYTYVHSKKIKGFDVQNILIPKDRLLNISDWYVKTGKRIVW